MALLGLSSKTSASLAPSRGEGLGVRGSSRRAGGERLGLKSLFSRLFQTSNSKLRTSSRRSLFRGLIHEPLEARQLLANDLYVGNITTTNGNTVDFCDHE